MKKIIISMAIGLFLAIGVQAQNAEEAPINPNAPVITLDKVEYDYGTMYQNADGSTFFTYTNDGKEPLILARVKSSCGCTIPKWSRQPLLPGQSDTLKIVYDTKRLGSFHKSVTISSNATDAKVVLKIKGKVIPEPQEGMPVKNVDNTLSPVNK